MPAGEHEAVAEALLRVADIPAHLARQQQRQQGVHLGARAARMPALAVVEDDVDGVVDQVFDHLPVGEVLR